MSDKHWSIKTALEQIASCNFECEYGPLKNNLAWDWLTKAAEVGPKFWPGQGVWFELSATVAGKVLKSYKHFFIVGCHMQTDTVDRYWVYDLSSDLPGLWDYRTVIFQGVRGERLKLENPTPKEPHP